MAMATTESIGPSHEIHAYCDKDKRSLAAIGCFPRPSPPSFLFNHLFDISPATDSGTLAFFHPVHRTTVLLGPLGQQHRQLLALRQGSACHQQEGRRSWPPSRLFFAPFFQSISPNISHPGGGFPITNLPSTALPYPSPPPPPPPPPPPTFGAGISGLCLLLRALNVAHRDKQEVHW